MSKGHLYIFGCIFPDNSSYADEWGVKSLKSLVTDYNNLPDKNTIDEVVVHIHSEGGDVNEGFAMYDFLVNTGKKITTVNEGMCASIASVVFLAGSERIMNENSQLMIHNPWGFAWGDHEEMQQYIDDLKAVEDRLVNFYAEKTGYDADKLRSMMADETWLAFDKAKEYGFATAQNQPGLVTAFKKSLQPTKDMKKNSDVLKAFNTAVAKVLNLAGIKAVNLDLKLKNGETLKIDTEETTIKVGDKTTAADGDYELEDGRTVTVKAGEVSAIKEATVATDPPAPAAKKKTVEEQLADLNQRLTTVTGEVTNLKAQNKTLSDENLELTTSMESMTANLESIAANVQSSFVPEVGKQNFVKTDTKKSEPRNLASNREDAAKRYKDNKSVTPAK